MKRRLTRAAELFADGDLDKIAYDGLGVKARADLDAVQVELDRIADVAPLPLLPPLDTVLPHVGGWASALTTAEVGPQRDVLGPLIEQAVPARLGRGSYQVETQWTPLGAALRSV